MNILYPYKDEKRDMQSNIPQRCIFVRISGFKSTFPISTKQIKLKVFFNTPIGGLKLNHQLVQCGKELMIQFGLFRQIIKKKKKIVSVASFGTKVTFVAPKSILELYGVCPIDNRPSTDGLHQFVNKKINP